MVIPDEPIFSEEVVRRAQAPIRLEMKGPLHSWLWLMRYRMNRWLDQKVNPKTPSYFTLRIFSTTGSSHGTFSIGGSDPISWDAASAQIIRILAKRPYDWKNDEEYR